MNYLQGLSKLPAGVEAENVQQAKQSIIELNNQWTTAMIAARNRDPEAALTQAHAIQKRGAEVGTMLGLKTAS
jgi:hypothetical protein